jgi:hypothetical protein
MKVAVVLPYETRKDIAMTRLTDLPAEILVQILCNCQSIRRTLRLSSACRRTQQIWRENTAVIVCALFSFSRTELIEFLDSIHLEEPSPDALTPPSLPPSAPTTLNITIQYYLAALKNCHARIDVLAHLAKPQKTSPQYHALRTRSARYIFCIPLYLLLRRLIAGFEDASLLPAAYAALHALSLAQLEVIYTATRRFRREWLRHATRMGLEHVYIFDEGCDPLTTEPSSPLHAPWRFAVHVVACEYYFRPGTRLDTDADPDADVIGEEIGGSDEKPRPMKTEGEVVKMYRDLCTRWGDERCTGMFGGFDIPWSTERWRARMLEETV